ncbi:MAG: hypothetical protein A4C66_11585 [Nitrospira sp. HN-bin3]|uniref:hypothetical protein n=1 Tax=Nitrospira cf. moscoviensis SBR1015 TaxID=96242 RepID=UPI000A0A8A8F|nr:hypothetical protein [Nitrospira cf. moscoviensis SBR1015]OQW38602.1 MAG: hypothetical protein A4C66_11585 [Nitrospira sp. HN-bin3]
MAEAMKREARKFGRVEADDVPALGAEFWTPGRKVSGQIVGWRTVKSERAGQFVETTLYRLSTSGVTVGGEEVEEVEIGGLTGWRMALEKQKAENNFDRLQKGDVITLECLHVNEPKQPGHSPSPRFALEIVRP